MTAKIKPSARTHTPPKDYRRKKPDFNAPPSRQWYAVICNVNAERKAQRALDGSFMTYLPVTAKLQAVGGQKGLKAVIERPLFPRYLFVASRSPAFRFFDLAGVNGVESIVRVEGRPMPIPHSVIEAIMRRDLAGEFVEAGIESKLTLKDVGLSTGEKITVLDGPFQGLSGIINALMPQAHARVMLNIFGRMTRADLPIAQIGKVA